MIATNAPQVAATLEELRGALSDVAFSLRGPSDAEHEATRRRMVKSINEYVLPRVTESVTVPVVVLIAGAGGVGKSTVLNSLAATEVSAVSLTRPTTREPVIWANRRPADDFWGEFIGRVQDVSGRHVEVVVGDGEIASDIVLVDTPPLDLERTFGPVAAEEMLTLADLCIFVTSASRYADAAPYTFLAEANQQGVPVLFVLNKAPDDAWLSADLVNDFAARLSRRGLLPTPNPNLIFRVGLDPLTRPHHGLEAGAIAPLREELGALADPQFREEIVRQTTAASLRAITGVGAQLAADLRVDAAHAAALRSAVDDAYLTQQTRFEKELGSGAFAALARRKSFTDAATELAGIVTRRSGVAASEAALSWERLEGGDVLLAAGGPGLYRHGEETPYETVEILERWEQAAQTEAADARGRRSSARTRRRMGRFLWRAALEPGRTPSSAVARKLGPDADQLVAMTRTSLAASCAEAMALDAERFRTLVHEPVPTNRIGALEDSITSLVLLTGAASEGETTEAPAPWDGGDSQTGPVPALTAAEGGDAPDA